MTAGLVRGCGNRVKGGVYAVTKMSADGRPIEDFLVDPPAKVDEGALGLSNIGVKLIQTNDVWNVLDIVGQDSYPNVADFVEEVRRFGLSRRLPKTLDFSKLTAQSRIILLHRRAYIGNFKDYYAEVVTWNCPKNLSRHLFDVEAEGCAPSECCAALWWDDLDPATVTDLAEDEAAARGNPPRGVVRMMPAFNYYGRERPAVISLGSLIEPEYSLAIFAAFPIHNLAVIHDPDGSDEETLQAAGKANLPVALENE